MANYTVVKLDEVENQGVRLGLDANDMELRMARVAIEAENSGLSLLKLGPGFRSPYGHTHNVQEEIYVCIEGSMRMNVDGDLVEMTPLTAVRVSPAGMRAFEGGPEGATLLAIGAPNTGPGDGNNEPGWWAE
jgi:mannose-6-phosphate isomerase-like protein (cupin superfamily)